MGVKAVKRLIAGRLTDCWVYDIYPGGRRVRTPRGEYFPTKTECLDAVAAIYTDFRRERYLFPADRSLLTLTDLRETWIAKLKELGRSASYVASGDRSLKALSELMWPTSRIVDLKTVHLQRYYSQRLAEGLKPQTAYREMNGVMSALNSASELFDSLSDWRPPRKPKLGQPDSGRERVITREEEEKIIEALMSRQGGSNCYYVRARAQIARLFWLALRTGMRPGELLGLRKTSVSFDRAIKMPSGWIDVRRSHASEKTKTGKRRVIPMMPAVAQTLKEQIGQTDSLYVFPSPLDLKTRWASFLRGFEAGCELAGVPYGRDVLEGVVFYDTRHTAATRMLQAGVDLKTVGAILGHSDQYMTMHYAHATAESRYAAVASLGDDYFGVRSESTAQTDETVPVHSGPVAITG